jgi:hypothetical protein
MLLNLCVFIPRRLTTELIQDDPEYAYKKAIRQTLQPKIDALSLKRRARFSSLPWSQRQMLRCTKDTIDDRIVVSNAGSGKTQKIESNLSLVPLGHQRKPVTKLILDRFSLIDGLLAAYELGDVEAEAILQDMITPPKFEEKSVCYSCERHFSFTVFRHHCRCCGEWCC